MTNTSAPEKTPKAKGPIRTGAVVPSVVIIAIVWSYFYFFFDSHLARAIEFVGSRVHGAEVNVGDIDTSFLGASFRLQDLQVTDKAMPERNLVQVGEMRFQMLWDALLRMKFVVEDASILNIQAYTKRKSPGFVLPPPPPSENSLVARVQEEVLSQTKKRLNDNFLGDIANVLGGVDPKEQLKNIQADLKSSARVDALEKELTAKKLAWEQRIKELPKPKDVKDLEAQIKALQLDPKNPVEFAKNAKKAKEILEQAKAKVQLVEQSQKELTGDLNNYTKAISDLERMAAEDVADLQKRLAIPSIDPKEFSTQLFLGMLEGKLVSLHKYIAIARKYMPPVKSKAEKQAEAQEALVPRKRGEGVNYTFPITTGYPLFWLKKAAISSEIAQSEWAGKVKGELTNATSNPPLIGKPMKLHLAGDFPKQNILGLDFLATMDHTTERARENLKLKVASFPVPPTAFSDSPSIKFGILQAKGGSSLDATLVDQSINIAVKSQFNEVQYDLQAKNKMVQEILSSVVKGVPMVTMNADVTGSWDKFNLSVDSNLGRELSAGFERQLKAKVDEAKARLNAFVDEKIGPQKQKLKAQLDSLSGGVGKALGDRKSEMDGAVQSAEGSANPKSGGNVLEEGKKKLFKGLKF